MSTTEQDTGIDDEDRALLREILQFYESGAALPKVTPFRVQHVAERARLDALESSQLIQRINEHYYLTFEGLLSCSSAEARVAHERCVELLSELKDAYLASPGHRWDVRGFGERVGRSAEEVSRLVTLLKDRPGVVVLGFAGTSGFASQFDIQEPILDSGLPEWSEKPSALEDAEEAADESWIERVEISGYRPFSDLSASITRLTVIIGANASGKSSLFDALRMLAFAAERPLPPEIDPRNTAVSTLFHVGGPERIDLTLTVASARSEPLRYEVSILGAPTGPRVTRERLVAAGPLPEDATAAFAYLDFTRGKGTVRAHRQDKFPAQWSAPPNELALRGAQNPALGTLSRFQKFVASWRFYPGFDVSPQAAVRRPAHIEENPILAEDGANLTAVLNSLVLEHRDVLEELETYLRSVIPTFESLGVKPQGGRGMAIGVVRERGVTGGLTLADLSDGTLRLLCWLALALSPSPPPLMCLDEPEIGLHPRVLPTLAGAFKLASARSQLLIATHSPHFLSQFALEDVAVMRKEGGHAVFVRPAASSALQAEVAEIGGEALARLFLSEELEVLS